MTPFFAGLVAGHLVYFAVRDAGWQLDNEELVGAAPVPAALATGGVIGLSTLPVLQATETSLLTHWLAGSIGTAAGMICYFVMLEVLVDSEVDHNRWAPRLVPPLCEEGQRC